MRFKLLLEVNKTVFGNVLPIDYQYAMSSAIYKILSHGDETYATWLHDNGFEHESGKRFKLFCFSPLKIEKRHHPDNSDKLCINSDIVEWQISFLPEKSTEDFIKGLFSKQIFELANPNSPKVQFTIKQVEVMPEPIYSKEMTYSTMSPICVKFKLENGKIDYLSPKDVRSINILLDNLKDKYRSFYHSDLEFSRDEFKIEVLNEPKSSLINIKPNTSESTSVRGFKCQMKLTAPIELQKIAYESGLGSECSQGFGCLRVIKKPSICDD